MKFKESATIVTDDFWYDLLEGYINPEELLQDQKDIVRVHRAIATIRLFEMEAVKQGVIEEM